MAFSPNPSAIQAHFCVKSATEAIVFYEKAFGGRCTYMHMAHDGKRVLHANIALFGGEVMMHDEFPESGGDMPSPDSWSGSPLTLNVTPGDDVLSPDSRGGASIALHVNLPTPAEVDAAIARARVEGATIISEPQDMLWRAQYGHVAQHLDGAVRDQDKFWRVRYGRLRDPFGHVWAFNALLASA